MKTYLDCIPCFVSQALRAGRLSINDEFKIKLLLDEIGMSIKNISLTNSPPETALMIYEKIREVTGNEDPCKSIKEQSTRESLGLYPYLKQKVKDSDDPLLTAIRIAIAGNIIDFAVYNEFNISDIVNETLKKNFAVFDYEKFKEKLDETDEVLYIGDNAGETVFDRVLIEEIKKPVKFVVRECPIINDAVYEDAVMAGLDKVATIISSGTKAPGTLIKTCSKEFIDIIEKSKFTVSKGQGNYEGLSHEKYPIFYMLRAKCHLVAKNIGVKKDDIILNYIDNK